MIKECDGGEHCTPLYCRCQEGYKPSGGISCIPIESSEVISPSSEGGLCVHHLSILSLFLSLSPTCSSSCTHTATTVIIGIAAGGGALVVVIIAAVSAVVCVAKKKAKKEGGGTSTPPGCSLMSEGSQPMVVLVPTDSIGMDGVAMAPLGSGGIVMDPIFGVSAGGMVATDATAFGPIVPAMSSSETNEA